MTRLLTLLRYAIFFILAICFTVQASVAAWDLQIKGALIRHSELDSFLIFCGASGVLVIFPVTFIDFTRKNALFARVWFETAWLAVFFIFETAGAAALTALIPQLACGSISPSLRDAACTSTRVLAGVTWTITIIVLLSMTSLITCAILHHDDSPHVWQAGVRDFPWFEDYKGTNRLRSPPSSPRKCRAFILNSEKSVASTLVTPKPRRTAAPPLWTTYQIEHYQSRQSKNTSDQQIGLTNGPVEPPRAKHQLGARQITTVSLYPAYATSTLTLTPPSTKLSDGSPKLGRSAPSSSTTRFTKPLPRVNTAARGAVSSSNSPSSPLTPSRRSPRGPRNRPPPLDLSQVSSYR